MTRAYSKKYSKYNSGLTKEIYDNMEKEGPEFIKL